MWPTDYFGVLTYDDSKHHKARPSLQFVDEKSAFFHVNRTFHAILSRFHSASTPRKAEQRCCLVRRNSRCDMFREKIPFLIISQLKLPAS